MAVHRELGCGFLESVYRAAMAIELEARAIPFDREVPMSIVYRERKLPLVFRVDFLCFDEIIVEVKALHALGAVDHAQTINYLRASRHKRGLLLNFGSTSLQFKRIVNSERQSSPPPPPD